MITLLLLHCNVLPVLYLCFCMLTILLFIQYDYTVVVTLQCVTSVVIMVLYVDNIFIYPV